MTAVVYNFASIQHGGAASAVSVASGDAQLKTLPLGLRPGCALRREFEQAAATLPGGSGFVLSGIGSLSHASLRFAAQEAATQLDEPLGLLSLAGTVNPDGAHLHASVATASGQVLGGHVADGCIGRATAEIPLATSAEWRLAREHDAATGHAELGVRPTRGHRGAFRRRIGRYSAPALEGVLSKSERMAVL